MGILHLNTADYYYEQTGKGPPLLLIAGYSCDHTFWDNIVDSLAKQFTVIRFDNRGIGQTRDSGMPFTLEIMADDIIQLIKNLGFKKISIVGHSMGGILAQIIANDIPTLLNKIIILNSAKNINFRSLMALEMFLTLLKENAPIETVIEASFPWFFSSSFLKNKKNILTVKEKIMSNPYPQTLFDLERQFHALKQYKTKWEQEITIPTLIASSYDDIICLPRESEQLKEIIPLAKEAMISSGHSSPIENPIEVIKVLQDFLVDLS